MRLITLAALSAVSLVTFAAVQPAAAQSPQRRYQADRTYQAQVSQTQLAIAPGTTWACYTDSVSHAAMSGQFAFEARYFGGEGDAGFWCGHENAPNQTPMPWMTPNTTSAAMPMPKNSRITG